MKAFTTTLFIASLLYIFSLTANSQTSWQRFHSRHGYSVELPAYFKDGGTTASGLQYYSNTVDDNILIYVESMGGGSIRELKKSFASDMKTSGDVTYFVNGEKSYVVSGTNEGQLFYYKAILKGTDIHFLRIFYPPQQKALFDLILPRVVKSFK